MLEQLFMSVPTAQLNELDLSGGMPPHTRKQSEQAASITAAVRAKAVHIRDILSSFGDLLPSEYRPDEFQKIIRATSIDSDPRSHVKQRDLEASLFGLGACTQQGFEFLRTLQSDDILSRIYCDKLVKRFQSLFKSYDHLSPTAKHPNPQGKVTEIVKELRDLYQKAVQDRNERRTREAAKPELALRTDQKFASVLIIQLRALCEYSKVGAGSLSEEQPAPKKAKPSSSRRGPQSPPMPPSTKSILFQEVLGNASAQTGFFALDILEGCSAESLSPLQPGLRGLQLLLDSEGASQEYRNRFGALVMQEEEEAEE